MHAKNPRHSVVQFRVKCVGDGPGQTASYLQQNTRQTYHVFGHVRRVQESVPAHEALRLAVKTRTGVRPDDRLDWKRPRGRPRHTWIRQLEIDVGLTAAAAWDMAGDREV